MKKIICLVLALALLTVCCACSGGKDYSEYGDSAVLEIGSASAKAGSTVKMDISIHNNPGTSTIGIELDYDSSVLTPVSIERTGKLDGIGFFTSNLEGEDEYGAFSGDEGATVQGIWFNTSDFSDNGKVMTVTFEVADNAAAGDYAVKFVQHEDDLTNQELEYLDVAYIDGSVTVS
jgi:uncharacterized protein YxeA